MRFVLPVLLLLTTLSGLDVESGGRLSPLQSAIDVKHYKIDLRVDPYKQVISGEVIIRFKLLQRVDHVVMDLLDRYTISGTYINGMAMSHTRKKNKVFIDNQGIDPFIEHELRIKYGGKPPIAKNPPWDGGFTWSKDIEGRHWVGVSCQSNGAHVWYPCKEHPSDKVNGADVIITVPDPLMVVSNGVLISSVKEKDRWTKWHWRTEYPISAYNINFSIGDFDLVEQIGYVLDKPLEMVYYVLPEKIEGAQELLDDAEEHLNFYARAFGQYPWIKEKFGLVHTPFSGMEHQSIIAYGNNYKKTRLGYDFILLHEIGHEWWGNYLSVSDWADLWIHEGICTYAEAMYIEEKFGLETTRNFIDKRFKENISNTAPIIPMRNQTAKPKSGTDVYYKAAHFLHMIRYLVGKDILWTSLKEYLKMPKELGDNQTTTEEFISLINENSGSDLFWLAEQYLYSKDLPILQMRERKVNNKRFIDIWWREKGFKMPLEIKYDSFDGERKRSLELTNKPMRIVVPDSSDLVLDPNGWVLYDLVVLK